MMNACTAESATIASPDVSDTGLLRNTNGKTVGVILDKTQHA